VDLLGKPYTYHLRMVVACHNDHMDHGAVEEAHNHEEDSPGDHHLVGSSQDDRKDETEAAAEDPSFCNHHSHGA
jgi:hypothetical protein